MEFTIADGPPQRGPFRQVKTHYAPHVHGRGLHIALAAVCGHPYDYERTGDRGKVTCKNCLRVMAANS